ncbi:MAG: hypothetical protein AB1305_02960 [Candidatus Hadarchaeota archaeon]
MALGQLLVYLGGVIAVVMLWRGLWGLMDIYLFPNNRKKSYWASFIIGLVIIMIFLALLPRAPSL